MAPRRPWRVHVHDIGPNFSYTSRAAAMRRAAQLVADLDQGGEAYAQVTVYNADDAHWPMRRWCYRWRQAPVLQKLMTDPYHGWVDCPAPDATDPERTP